MPEEEKQLPTVHVERLDGNITPLKTYLDEEAITPLLIALEGLKAEPETYKWLSTGLVNDLRPH